MRPSGLSLSLFSVSATRADDVSPGTHGKPYNPIVAAASLVRSPTRDLHILARTCLFARRMHRLTRGEFPGETKLARTLRTGSIVDFP